MMLELVTFLYNRVPNSTELTCNSILRSIADLCFSDFAISFGDNMVASSVIRDLTQLPVASYYYYHQVNMGSTNIVYDESMLIGQYVKTILKISMILGVSKSQNIKQGFNKLTFVGASINFLVDPLTRVFQTISYEKQDNNNNMSYYEFITTKFDYMWIWTSVIAGGAAALTSEVTMSVVNYLGINKFLREKSTDLQNLSVSLLISNFHNFDAEQSLAKKLSFIPEPLDSSTYSVLYFMLVVIEFVKQNITHTFGFIFAAPFVRTTFDGTQNFFKHHVLQRENTEVMILLQEFMEQCQAISKFIQKEPCLANDFCANKAEYIAQNMMLSIYKTQSSLKFDTIKFQDLIEVRPLSWGEYFNSFFDNSMVNQLEYKIRGNHQIDEAIAVRFESFANEKCFYTAIIMDENYNFLRTENISGECVTTEL